MSEQLSKNFRRSEFACRCGCGFDEIDPLLVRALQDLRDMINQPIHVNSGCRCPAHNEAVGGAKNSYHMKGMAADIACRWIGPKQLRAFAIQVPEFYNGGIGLYPGFLHVDIRHGKTRW